MGASPNSWISLVPRGCPQRDGSGAGRWLSSLQWHIPTMAPLFPAWALVQVATTIPCQGSWVSQGGGIAGGHPFAEMKNPIFSAQSFHHSHFVFLVDPRGEPGVSLGPAGYFGYFGSERQKFCHEFPDGHSIMAGMFINNEILGVFPNVLESFGIPTLIIRKTTKMRAICCCQLHCQRVVGFGVRVSFLITKIPVCHLLGAGSCP